jgi:hypothetical protein
MLLDHSRMSVSRSHSQVPVCASCSARSSAAWLGRSGSVPDLSVGRPAPLFRGRRCDRCLVGCFGGMRASSCVTAAEPLHLSARRRVRPIVRYRAARGTRSDHRARRPWRERVFRIRFRRCIRSARRSARRAAGHLWIKPARPSSPARRPARDAAPTTPAGAATEPHPPAGPPRIHCGSRRAAGYPVRQIARISRALRRH